MVDVSKSHLILEKIDGSFIAPFKVRDRMIYGTKMGETNVSRLVDDFVSDKPGYRDFNDMLIEKGFTPIYEYVGPDNRIVVPYKQRNLILLAIRNMHTGEYTDYQTMSNMAFGFDIPVVNARKGTVGNMQSLDEMVEEFRALADVEGYVIRFDSGYMVKIKADEYVLKHKVKDSISQEKNLVELIFSEKVDDVYATLDQADVDKVKIYADSVLGHALDLAGKLKLIVTLAKEAVGDDKKRFACEIVPKHREYSSLLFTLWEGKDAWKSIQDCVLKNCQTQTKIDKMRHILGDMLWKDIYTSNLE